MVGERIDAETCDGPETGEDSGTSSLLCQVLYPLPRRNRRTGLYDWRGGVTRLSIVGEPYLHLVDVSHQLSLARGRCVVWMGADTVSPLSLCDLSRGVCGEDADSCGSTEQEGQGRAGGAAHRTPWTRLRPCDLRHRSGPDIWRIGCGHHTWRPRSAPGSIDALGGVLLGQIVRLAWGGNIGVVTTDPLSGSLLGHCLGDSRGGARCFKLLDPFFQCSYGLPEFRKPWNHGLGLHPDFMRHHGSP